MDKREQGWALAQRIYDQQRQKANASSTPVRSSSPFSSRTLREDVADALAAVMTRPIWTGYQSGTAANAMSSTAYSRPLPQWRWLETTLTYGTKGVAHLVDGLTQVSICGLERSFSRHPYTFIVSPIVQCRKCARIYQQQVLRGEWS